MFCAVISTVPSFVRSPARQPIIASFSFSRDKVASHHPSQGSKGFSEGCVLFSSYKLNRSSKGSALNNKKPHRMLISYRLIVTLSRGSQTTPPQSSCNHNSRNNTSTKILSFIFISQPPKRCQTKRDLN